MHIPSLVPLIQWVALLALTWPTLPTAAFDMRSAAALPFTLSCLQEEDLNGGSIT
jgi:hypothetical protein